MRIALLPRPEADRLRALPLTYAPVGLSAGTATGFTSFTRSRVLRRRDFETAAAELMSWQVQSRAGLRVAASDLPARVDTVVLLRLGVGALALRIPCRVVRVVAEPDRRGFAYGTLPGHPEQGEELFVLTRRPDGSLELAVSATSRPATRLARLGGPVGQALQRVMAGRYLRALDR